MTVEFENMSENENNYEQFPVGLRVLAVDDDLVCLKLLESMLRKCHYEVTTTSHARAALKMLRENKGKFDLVISDVHMPDMDGFRLLELVGLELDLPVIMLSANSDPKNVMKGVTHGACDYLVKPVRLAELGNIWQHVLRRKKFEPKNLKETCSDQGHKQQQAHPSSGEVCKPPPPLSGSSEQNKKSNRKRKDEEYENEENGSESDPGTQKKARVNWTTDLHVKFVAAVTEIGIDQAVPKKILELMNDDRLTRENVASHLQKYRIGLKKLSEVAANQQANMITSPFMHMRSLDRQLGDFQTLAGSARRGHNVALSSLSTGGGMLSRINSPSNVNLLRNPTPSPLLQPPSQPQKLINSISALGKIHPLLSPPVQKPSLLQGMPSGLELDQLKQNKGVLGITNFNSVDESRMFTNPSTFTNPGTSIAIAGLSSLVDPGRCNDKWQNTIYSAKMESPHSLLPQLPSDYNSLNDPYLQNHPFEDSSEGLVGWEEERQNYPQWSTNAIGSLNSDIPGNVTISSTLSQSLEPNSGVFNEKMDMLANGNDKSQGGFLLRQNSFDELFNAVFGQVQHETMQNCDIGIDDFPIEPAM